MPSSTDKEVRVRMYRQGLGDCFLLTIAREPEPFHMLIDCGALDSSHYDDSKIKDVVRDIKSTTSRPSQARGRLDVVAATHEHWDHISGFSQAEEIFAQIDVEEVWVAWTEEPFNEAARQLKRDFKKKKKAVEMALTRIPDDEEGKQLHLYKHAITDLFGFFGGVGAAGGRDKTAKAWETLLGMGRKVYCNPKKQPLKIRGRDDVRVYVLGPPEDPEYVKKRLSTRETYDEGRHGFSLFDSFLAAVDPENTFDSARALPFDEHYCVNPDQAQGLPFFQQYYFGIGAASAEEWRRIDYDWLNIAGELALHLDSYTNNTCLAFAVELGEPGRGKVLLFPGDAQVGNWLSWGELSWQAKDSKGDVQTVTIDDLLARTVLYKVGHHGSHNATLKAKGLEKMVSSELVAMIPVHRETAKSRNWEFPYHKLWSRLKEKARGRVLLADAERLEEIADEAKGMLRGDEWEQFVESVSFEDLYIEYRISY